MNSVIFNVLRRHSKYDFSNLLEITRVIIQPLSKLSYFINGYDNSINQSF